MIFLKWAAFIPKHAQSSINQALHEKGIEMDFLAITPQDIEELARPLNGLAVEVEGKEKVWIGGGRSASPPMIR